jgi:hypothetical protein
MGRDTVYSDIIIVLRCFGSFIFVVRRLLSISTLKMQTVISSETLVKFNPTTWPHISEEVTLHNHRPENLESWMNVRILRIPISVLIK